MGIFISMVRVVMVVLAVLAFAALTWATGLVGDLGTAWAPSIVAVTGGWGLLGGIAVFVVGGMVLLHRHQRQADRRRFATTGVIDQEVPHPWPWWLRTLAFAPLALGMVAVIVAASRGL